MSRFRTRCAPVLTFLCVAAVPAFAQNYQITNLVSDGTIEAAHTDANLVNGWGLSRSSTSPWWISDNGTGKATLYDGAGVANSRVVTIPALKPDGTGTPTGTIFNGNAAFALKPGLFSLFLFATEDGTISGWNPNVDPNAQIMAKRPKAVYKGLAQATLNGAQYLYAANFHSGRIDVYDTNFQPVFLGPNAFTLDGDRDDFFSGKGAWTNARTHAEDFWLFRRMAPFNIQNIGGTLFVTFAQQDAMRHDEVAGAGLGLVALFTPAGKLIRVLEHGPFLNAPWGVVAAPSDFGGFSHALLVGQFGSGEIVAYNINTGQFLGRMLDANGSTIVIDGLWALSFGNGGTAGPLNTLYFTAGPNDESHGLFGSLTAVAATQTMGNGL